METTHDRRVRKLRELVDRVGGVREVANAADVNPQTLSQILAGVLLPPKADGTQSPRSVGNSLARKIEAGLELEHGWFDAPDAPAVGSAPAAQASYGLTGSQNEPEQDPANFAHEAETVAYAGIPKQPGMAKVTAVARVGEEGFFDEERFKGDTGGWVPAFSETHTYAVRIKGDGLAPAIENGVYLLVEPGAPVHNGERVLVNFKDGRKAIRKLLYERGGDLAVMLVTGGAQHTIEAAEVESVHPIFGIIEASRWRASLGGQAPAEAPDAEPDAPGRPASRYVKSENMGAAKAKPAAKKRSA
jgi:phage repressor protein C with HTH and peptisase S24 domain